MKRSAGRPNTRRSWWASVQRWWQGSREQQTLRQRRGRASERLACAYLRRQGYQIEATNVRFPIGELDVIAREGDALCVIEVRSKASEAYGSALESITHRKRRHLIRAAQWHLQRRRPPWTGPVRFDVLAIQHQGRSQPTVQLIRGAFTSDRGSVHSLHL